MPGRSTTTDARPTACQSSASDDKIFHAYFQHAPIAIMVADADGRILYANPAALGLLGYSLEEILQKRVPELHAEGDRRNVSVDFPRFVSEGSSRREVQLLCKDGRVIVADLHGVITANGHLLGFFEDVTEKVRSRRELEESEARFRQFFHQITDGVAIHTIAADGTPGPFLEVNDGICAMLGYAREEMLGLSPGEFQVEAKKQKLLQLKEQLFAGGTVNFEHEVKRKDGSTIPVEIRAALFRYQGQPAVIANTRDISERKEAEDRLWQSTQRLEMALEAGRLGIVETDEELGTVTGNPHYWRLLGMPEEPATRPMEAVMERLHPEDREMAAQQMAAGRERGRIHFECRSVWPDGSVHWGAVSGEPLTTNNGCVTKWIGTVQDITDAKREEEETRRRETQLRLALQAAELGMYEYDATTDTAIRNLKHSQIFGYEHPPDKWSPAIFLDHVVAEDRAVVEKAMRDSETTGKVKFQCRITWPDRSLHWIEVMGETHVGQNGRVAKRVGTVKDITERKLAEIQLAESEERFRGYFHHMRDAVVFHGVDGECRPTRFFDVNDATCRLLGYSREELLQLSPLDIDAPESTTDVATVIKRLLAGEGVVFEQTHVAKDGHRIPVEINSHRLQYQGQAWILSVIRDISERKRVEERSLENAMRLEMALEAGKLGIIDVDVLSGRVQVNDEVCQMWGQAPTTLVWTPEQFYEQVHPDDVGEITAGIKRANAVGRAQVNFRVVWPDGSTHWLHGRLRSIRDESGTVVKRIGTIHEVTEQKEAEQALRESATRLEMAVEAGHLGIYDHDLVEGTITSNSEHRRMFGFDDASAVRDREEFYARFHPEDRVQVMQDLAKSDRDGASTSEFRTVWPDGSVHWIQARSKSLHDEDGRTIRRIGAAVDITERKEAEVALRESDELHRSILAATAEGIVAQNGQGEITAVNARAEQILDRNLHELDGATSDDPMWGAIREDGSAFPGEEHPAMVTLRTGKATADVVMGIQSPEGKRKWISVSTQPMVNKRGNQIDGVVSTFLDITARRVVEKELVRYRQLLEAFISHTPAAIAMFDREMRYIRTSRKWCEDLDLPPDQPLTGRKHYDVFPHLPDDVKDSHRRGLAGELVVGETQWIRADGRQRQLQWEVHPWGESIRALDDSTLVDGGGIMVMFEDVTERRKLEAQLRQALKMEAVGQLAGGVAHDFNNLLQVILGYGEMLQEQFPKNASAVHKTNAILDATRRATSLTRQLLAFSRKQILHPVVIDLNAVVESTSTMLKRLLPENIDVGVSLGDELWHTEADADQMSHVLINLAVNARDAMPRGGKLTISTANAFVTPGTAGAPPATKPGEYILLKVQDTGAGIDADVMSHLFEPFYTTKAKGKGTGLGLASVYGIVKQSAGFVWATSSPGHGACFTVCLPRTKKHEAPQFGSGGRIAVRQAATLLVVDDDPVVRMTVSSDAEALGYTVLSAGPETALQVAQEHGTQIDVLVTDVVMPGTSGPELVTEVRALNPHIKTVFISGYVDSSFDHPDLMRLQAVLLHKPFGREELALKIKEALQW